MLIKLNIGSENEKVKNTRPVEFEGENLAERREYEGDDTRGTDETLYSTPDGRFIVYEESWSKWQGEYNNYSLHEVHINDLGINGWFEALGRIAGFGRPLTLDEALEA